MENLYLTKIQINQSKKAPTIYNDLHKYFKTKSIDNSTKEPLWRLEDNYILIQSEEMVDFTDFCKKFSYQYKEAEWKTKNIKNLYDNIKNNNYYHFKIKAYTSVKREGKDHPIRDHKKRRDWIERKAEENGFVIKDVWITDTNDIVFKHKDSQMVLLPITFEGILSVKNEDVLKDVLLKGIGKKRTFGMGMLSLVPCK